MSSSETKQIPTSLGRGSAVCAASPIKNMAAHVHAVLSLHLALLDIFADKQVAAFNGARKERSRPDGAVRCVFGVLCCRRRL